MTIREFFESEKHLAIHCDSEDKAIKLLTAFDNQNYKWCDNSRYTAETCYSMYKEETCYSNDRGYCCKEWYNHNEYTILKFEDIELDEFKTDLTQFSIAELLREIERRIKVNNNDNN